MDATGVWYFGIRNVCKSMASQPVRSSVGLLIILVGIPFFYFWHGRSVPSSHLVEATPSCS